MPMGRRLRGRVLLPGGATAPAAAVAGWGVGVVMAQVLMKKMPLSLDCIEIAAIELIQRQHPECA
jgi:hypothetical protein